jgi:hypothetical protein
VQALERRDSTEGGARGRAIGEGESQQDWNDRDPGRDPGQGEAWSQMPQNEETSMKDAECARGDSNSQALRRRNLNPAFGDRRKQTPGKSGGEPAPETTGAGPGSQSGVTMTRTTVGPVPLTPLELLRAAGQAYYDAGNWTALATVQPLIDAERARLAEAARAAPPEPVRLEVVRAERGRK